MGSKNLMGSKKNFFNRKFFEMLSKFNSFLVFAHSHMQLPNPLASAFQQAQAVASSITANIQSQDPFAAMDASMGESPSPVGGVQASAAPVLPSMPPITGNVDPSKIDEIRRTIYVGNLSSTVREGERERGKGEVKRGYMHKDGGNYIYMYM